MFTIGYSEAACYFGDPVDGKFVLCFSLCAQLSMVAKIGPYGPITRLPVNASALENEGMLCRQ